MKLSILFIFAILTACTHSPSKIDSVPPAKDVENIKSFAGCYDVNFNFAETFPVAEGYQIKKPQHSTGTEYVVVDKDSNNEIHLQHILVSKRGGKVKAMKHWRQEWVFEPTEVTNFKGNHEWQTVPVQSPAGFWNQSVTQVDDSPRYECLAKWVQLDAGSYWECKSWNPLPRREYTSRQDYQVLDRMNRQKLTAFGWVHEQDSTKLQLTDNAPKSLVKERGENTYTKISDDNCLVAKQWWQTHGKNWKSIRLAWAEAKKENPTMKLNFKTEEGDLIDQLNRIDQEAHTQDLSDVQVLANAKKLITGYIQPLGSAKTQ